MFKKIVCLLLSAGMLTTVSCDSKEKPAAETTAEAEQRYESVELMKDEVDGIWMNRETEEYMMIEDGILTRFDSRTRNRVINKLNRQINENSSFSSYYKEYLVEAEEAIEYDCKNGYINLSSTGEYFFEMHPFADGEAFSTKTPDYYIKKNSMTENDLKDELKDDFIRLKYPGTISNKDAQFDKYGNRGKNFVISGSAKLDDYYNWNYSGYEAGYFCMKVAPVDGKYSDEWYIYASREDFKGLYDSLIDGPKSGVKMVAKLVYADTGSNNMATLVEYFG